MVDDIIVHIAIMEGRAFVIVVLVVCMAWQAQADFNCTSAGRFADPADTTCQNYTLCVYDSSDDSFVSFEYVCPTTSVFNPTTSQCTDSSNYECNVTSTTNNTTGTTGSDSVCTTDGYVPDSNSTNCSGYIQCVEINGTFTETNYTCPDGTYFNPNTTDCEFNYNCVIPFTCSGAGRFANTADPRCKTYYFCVLASNGTYVSYEYTCPTASFFSPTASVCTTNYTCTIQVTY